MIQTHKFKQCFTFYIKPSIGVSLASGNRAHDNVQQGDKVIKIPPVVEAGTWYVHLEHSQVYIAQCKLIKAHKDDFGKCPIVLHQRSMTCEVPMEVDVWDSYIIGYTQCEWKFHMRKKNKK